MVLHIMKEKEGIIKRVSGKEIRRKKFTLSKLKKEDFEK